MLLLFTDFGWAGPYVGQMKTVLAEAAPGVPVIDLMHDAPAFRPRESAYLLAALAGRAPARAVFVAVVDPGVGGARAAVVAEADGRRFVGPDNGLLALVVRRAASARAWEIDWRPERLSASFHGRDLFAPVAARLVGGEAPPGRALDPKTLDRSAWPDDLAAVIHVDDYGNAATGMRAAAVPTSAVLRAGGAEIRWARVFSEAAPGAAFWYENANGLVEIACDRGRADAALGIGIGSPVALV